MVAGFGNAVADTGVRETRWLTPKYIVEALGDFDLDPCGAPDHNLAKRTYLLENDENGLTLPWVGKVWCNPPYGKEAAPFLKRLTEHPDGGYALIFARTETKMFFDYVWDKATAVFFFKGRIKFLKADLTEGESANAPSVLIAYGEENAKIMKNAGLKGKYIYLGNNNGN